MRISARSPLARGDGSRGGERAGGNPAYVRVVNPCWNGKPVMKRKDAEHYVREGRAEWLVCRGKTDDQIRLLDHSKNRSTAAEAAADYRRAAARVIRSADELTHIPVLMPRIALTDRSVPAVKHFAGRSGPVRAIQVP